jgi:hypothetical protein
VVDVAETSEACVSLVVEVNVVGHVTQKTEAKVFEFKSREVKVSVTKLWWLMCIVAG